MKHIRILNSEQARTLTFNGKGIEMFIIVTKTILCLTITETYGRVSTTIDAHQVFTETHINSTFLCFAKEISAICRINISCPVIRTATR